MTSTNTFYNDSVIRRALYVERLKAGQRIYYDEILAVILPRLRRVLMQYDVERISELTTPQLKRLLNELDRELDKAGQAFAKRLLTWLRRFSRDQNDWNEQLMHQTIDDEEEGLPAVPYTYTDNIVFSALLGSTGMNIKDSIDGMIRTQRQHVIRRVKMAAAQNMTVADTVKTVIGTKTANYRDGLFSQLRNFAHETVGSVIQFAANSTNMGFMNKYQDWVDGYMWVSVLDSRTSGTCRSLDGQVFGFGEGPMPPAHPNCRSHITAVFKSGIKFLKGLTRKTSSGSIDAGVTYYTWLKKQSAKFQDSVLGKTRGKLFRDGGVSAEDFRRLNIGRNFEQLTLDELRELYPDMFEEAGID